MRRKKLKASKRVVRYFKLHFGFREPFKVLLDGNFIHSMAQMKYDNLEDMVSTLLGGKVRLFVPSCAMRELRDLAKQDKTYSAAVSLARKFLRHKDACAPTESTHEILLKQVENGNDQHWWLATQDRTLWTTLREDASRAVPILYASATGLHLLPPSDSLKGHVSDTLTAKMQSSEHEQAFVADAAAAPKSKGKWQRKHAAAPNPLSVKKSSKVQKHDARDAGPNQKRIRRKRQHDDGEPR